MREFACFASRYLRYRAADQIGLFFIETHVCATQLSGQGVVDALHARVAASSDLGLSTAAHPITAAAECFAIS